jgi:hypothetical protein
MSSDAQSRPGFERLAAGVIFLALAVARLAGGPGSGPGWPWPDVVGAAGGAAVALWGWSVLRRAKAGRPDLTWRQFLRGDLVAALVMAVVIPLWAAMPAEWRDAVLRRLAEGAELITVARGGL